MVTSKYTKYSLLIAIFCASLYPLKTFSAAGSSDDFARDLHTKFATEEATLRSIKPMSEGMSTLLTRQLNIISAGIEGDAMVTEIRSILQGLLQHSREISIVLQATVQNLGISLESANTSISLERDLHSRLHSIAAYHANTTGSASTNDTIEGTELMAEGLDKSNARIGIYTSIISRSPEILELGTALQENLRKIQVDIEAAMGTLGSGGSA